jgi:hypothetical protein
VRDSGLPINIQGDKDRESHQSLAKMVDGGRRRRITTGNQGNCPQVISKQLISKGVPKPVEICLLAAAHSPKHDGCWG